MLRLLKQQWWKYLSLVLLMYSTITGLYIPLSAGITAIDPSQSVTGQHVSLLLQGYNTHFSQANAPEVLLKNDSSTLCATSVKVEGPQVLNVAIDLPADLKVNDAQDMYNVIVNDKVDGTFFLRNAFIVTRADSTSGTAKGQCKTDLTVLRPQHTTFPYRVILYETIRNLYFHVPMWFSMIFLLIFSFGCSLAYLNTSNPRYDLYAKNFAAAALLFGTLGILTGMIWAKNTWGAYWTNDPRLNGAAVGMLVYMAYFVLRGSLDNEIVRAKVSSVYGIFAFVIYLVFIFIIPRINDSLHPGTGGNPAFSSYDLDNTMRMVFYPACIGFISLGFWIASLLIRTELAEQQLSDENA